jgi:probable phosphoglycerate mutase
VTLCLLIRHAAYDGLGRVLVGRLDGVELNAQGREQARALARRLGPLGIAHVQSSPRRRAQQTAAPIACHAGCAVETCSALDEVDFGAWAGRSFEELASEEGWRLWNEERGSSRTPGGETMAGAQARIVSHLERMHALHSGLRIVMVSHAEVIRAAALHFMSLPLDAWRNVVIPPASITRVQLLASGRGLVRFEERAAA